MRKRVEKTSSNEALTDEQLRLIFDRDIAPRLFSDLTHPENTAPKAIFIGGQPGSGKSARERQIIEELGGAEPHTSIEINGDDYRAFHPNYFRFLKEDDSTAASRIDPDNAKLINMAIERTLELGCSVLIEGTFRREAVVAETAARYSALGYETQAILLTVHPLLSRLGVIQRYIAQKQMSPFARFTERRAHDASFAGIPLTIERLITEESVDRLMLIDRSNDTLFDAELAGSTARQKKDMVKQVRGVMDQRFNNISAGERAFLAEQTETVIRAAESVSIPEAVMNELEALLKDILDQTVEKAPRDEKTVPA